MEHPDLGVARRAVAAWNAGEVEALVACFDPGCRLDSYLAQGAEPFRGHQGVRNWEREIRQSFGRFDCEVEEATRVNEVVLVLAHIHLKGQASGVPLVQPAGFVMTMAGGSIVTFRGFASHQEAREAADGA